MSKVTVEIGKYAGNNTDGTPMFYTVGDWCDDCYLDKPSYKCHLAIGRPGHTYLDDDIKYKRPDDCKLLETTWSVKRVVGAFCEETMRRIRECREHQAKCEATGQYTVSGLQQEIIDFYEDFHKNMKRVLEALDA